MKIINWSDEKNEIIKKERNISFEDVIFYIENQLILDDFKHPNKEKYPNQRIMIIEHSEYVYLVPYVDNENELFLKNIIPSRKATKQYLGGKK